jgi:hypothetical protein
MQHAVDNSYTVAPGSVQIHPIANSIRMMNTTEYEDLKRDISEQGQLVPAVLLDGMLIDGRNRQRACEELGLELRVEEHTAADPDPKRLVWSYNAARRQITKGQRTALASDMANVENGSNQWLGPKVGSSQRTTHKPVTQQEAAQTFGIDSSQLRKFRMVEDELPEEAERIRKGETSVEPAYKKAAAKRKKAQTTAAQPAKNVVPIKPQKQAQNEESQTAKAASWDDLLACLNISAATIQQAKADIMHPQYMVACRLDESRERITKSMAGLGKPDRKKAMQAVVSVLAHAQEVFEAEAKALMPKYNRELEQRLKSEIDAQKAVTSSIKKMAKDGFDKSDFKIIRGVLHPDRSPTEEQRSKAFDLFLKLEPLFK